MEIRHFSRTRDDTPRTAKRLDTMRHSLLFLLNFVADVAKNLTGNAKSIATGRFPGLRFKPSGDR